MGGYIICILVTGILTYLISYVLGFEVGYAKGRIDEAVDQSNDRRKEEIAKWRAEYAKARMKGARDGDPDQNAG